MIESIKLNATLNGYNYGSILRLNQYDKGVPVKVNLTEKSGVPYVLQTNDVVFIEWALQGKFAYIQNTNIVKGNTYIDFLTDENIAALPGEGHWNVVITSGDSERVASFRIPLIVEKNSVNDDTVEPGSLASAIDELRDLIRQAQEQGITGIEVENNLNSDSSVKALAAAQGKELNVKIANILTSLESCGVELVNNDGMLCLLNADGTQLGTGIDISKINNALVYQTIVAGSSASNKHGIAYNSPSAYDIDIFNKNITANSGYGILLNYGMYNSKRARIVNNTVNAASDAVELNHPLQYEDGKDIFQDCIVALNLLDVNTDGTSSTAGFAVGMAQTNNLAVIGNVSNHSQVGGFHVEDAQKNVLAVGNVFAGCKREGVALYGRTKGLRGGDWYAHPVIVSSNQISSLIPGQGNGLWNTTTDFGNLEGSILTGNRFEGFDIGIRLDGRASVNLDNCLVQNCNVGIKASQHGRTVGCVTSIDTPVLVNLMTGSEVDEIFSYTEITDPMKAISTAQMSAGTSAVIKKYGYKLPLITLADGKITQVIGRIPTYAKGKILIKARSYGNHAICALFDIEIKNGNITSEQLYCNVFGAIANVAIEATADTDENFGNIALTYDSSLGTTEMETSFEFDGYSFWKKGNSTQENNAV